MQNAVGARDGGYTINWVLQIVVTDYMNMLQFTSNFEIVSISD
jgi:hypothetical protein